MRRLILLTSLLISVVCYGQLDESTEKLLKDQAAKNKSKDTVWMAGGVGSLNFSQVALSNWAGGGQSAASIQAMVSYHVNYFKDKTSWDNTFDLSYGVIKQENLKLFKNDDKLEINSKFGHRIKEKNAFYSALMNFKSQFDNGYNNAGDHDSTYISRFMAPGYIIGAVGVDFQPNKDFSLFLSPATVKTTIVGDTKLSNAGSFGVDPGQRVRTEMGGYLKLSYQKKEPFGMENVLFKTKLDLFSNYLDNPGNIDVNWEVLVNMKVNKYLSVSLSTYLIYDDDVDINRYESDGVTPIYHMRDDGSLYTDSNGDPIQVKGPITQFKEVLSIGFSYKF